MTPRLEVHEADLVVCSPLLAVDMMVTGCSLYGAFSAVSTACQVSVPSQRDRFFYSRRVCFFALLSSHQDRDEQAERQSSAWAACRGFAGSFKVRIRAETRYSDPTARNSDGRWLHTRRGKTKVKHYCCTPPTLTSARRSRLIQRCSVLMLHRIW